MKTTKLLRVCIWLMLSFVLILAACSDNGVSDIISVPISFDEEVGAAEIIVDIGESEVIGFEPGAPNIVGVVGPLIDGTVTLAIIAKGGAKTLGVFKAKGSDDLNIVEAKTVAGPATTGLVPLATTLGYNASHIDPPLARYELGDVGGVANGAPNGLDLGDLGLLSNPAALTPQQQVIADFDGNGFFNDIDSVLVLNKRVGNTIEPSLFTQPNPSITVSPGGTGTVLVFNSGTVASTQPTSSIPSTVVESNNGFSWAYEITPLASGNVSFAAPGAGATVFVNLDASGGGGGGNGNAPIVVQAQDGTNNAGDDRVQIIEQNVGGATERIEYVRGMIDIIVNPPAEPFPPEFDVGAIDTVEVFLGRTETDTSNRIYDGPFPIPNPLTFNSEQYPQGDFLFIVVRYFDGEDDNVTEARPVVPDNLGPQFPDIFEDVSQLTPQQTNQLGTWVSDDVSLKLENLATLIDNPQSTPVVASGVDRVNFYADNTPFDGVFDRDCFLGFSLVNPYEIIYPTDAIVNDDVDDSANACTQSGVGLLNGTYRIFAVALDQLDNESVLTAANEATSSFVMNVDNIQPNASDLSIVDRGIGDVDSIVDSCLPLGTLPNIGSNDPDTLGIFVDDQAASAGFVSGCAIIDGNFADEGVGLAANSSFTFGDKSFNTNDLNETIVDVNDQGEGPISLTGVARDLLGHEFNGPSVQSIVDNTPPVNLQFTSPSLTPTYPAWDQANIAAQADDALSGVRNEHLFFAYVDNNGMSPAEFTGDTTFTFPAFLPFPQTVGSPVPAGTTVPGAMGLAQMNHAIEFQTATQGVTGQGLSLSSNLRLPAPNYGAIHQLAIILKATDHAGNSRANYIKLAIDATPSFSPNRPEVEATQFDDDNNGALTNPQHDFELDDVSGVHHEDYPRGAGNDTDVPNFRLDATPGANGVEQIGFYYTEGTGRHVLGFPSTGSMDTNIPINERNVDLIGYLIGNVENNPFRVTWVTDLRRERFHESVFALQYNNTGGTAISFPTNEDPNAGANDPRLSLVNSTCAGVSMGATCTVDARVDNVTGDISGVQFDLATGGNFTINGSAATIGTWTVGGTTTVAGFGPPTAADGGVILATITLERVAAGNDTLTASNAQASRPDFSVIPLDGSSVPLN